MRKNYRVVLDIRLALRQFCLANRNLKDLAVTRDLNLPTVYYNYSLKKAVKSRIKLKPQKRKYKNKKRNWMVGWKAHIKHLHICSIKQLNIMLNVILEVLEKKNLQMDELMATFCQLSASVYFTYSRVYKKLSKISPTTQTFKRSIRVSTRKKTETRLQAFQTTEEREVTNRMIIHSRRHPADSSRPPAI